MHLLGPLAAGIRGAEHGYVDLFRRGTTHRIRYYRDFEGTSVHQPSGRIPLDSQGSLIAYVEEITRVVVYASDGSRLREFTDGVGAGAVEVRSDSFRGTDYRTGVYGVLKPLTLTRVLEAVGASLGSYDFEVDLQGSSTPLVEAFGALTRTPVNVRDPRFGAVGDGVVDDTAALQAAITEALSVVNLGVVYLPPGVYRTTAALPLLGNCTLLGAGPDKTTIQLDSTTASAIEVQGIAGHARIHGLAIRANQATSAPLIKGPSLGMLVVEHCYVGRSGSGSASLLDYYDVVHCKSVVFSQPSPTGAMVRCEDNSGKLSLEHCTFSYGVATYAPTSGALELGDAIITGCRFEASASVGVAPFTWLQFGSQGVYAASVVGCDFGGHSSSTVAMDFGAADAGHRIYEDNNRFADDITPYAWVLVPGATPEVTLGSRRGKQITVNVSGAVADITDAAMRAETVVVRGASTAAMSIAVAGGSGIAGMPLNVLLWNASGGATVGNWSFSGTYFSGAGTSLVAPAGLPNGQYQGPWHFTYVSTADGDRFVTGIPSAPGQY